MYIFIDMFFVTANWDFSHSVAFCINLEMFCFATGDIWTQSTNAMQFLRTFHFWKATKFDHVMIFLLITKRYYIRFFTRAFLPELILYARENWKFASRWQIASSAFLCAFSIIPHSKRIAMTTSAINKERLWTVITNRARCVFVYFV